MRVAGHQGQRIRVQEQSSLKQPISVTYPSLQVRQLVLMQSKSVLKSQILPCQTKTNLLSDVRLREQEEKWREEVESGCRQGPLSPIKSQALVPDNNHLHNSNNNRSS